MARLSPVSVELPANSAETATVELGVLLNRLEHTVLHADAKYERRLRTDEFERTRLGYNLDYARTVLTKLEQDALSIKIHSKKLEVQSDLNRKREVLDQLLDRLNDFKELAIEDDDDATSEDEDILAEIIPTPSESMESQSTDLAHGESDDIPNATDLPETQPPPSQASTELLVPSEEATSTTQTLRRRGPPAIDTPSTQAPDPEKEPHRAARAALFGRRTKAHPAPAASSTATAEALLDHHRHEQDGLSESILQLAGALKAQSQRFATTLDQDKEVLAQAGKGMDSTERGMDAATRRMGALKRITEGKGWWGRVMLYAWIFGLWVALLVLVFVLPKLRF